MIQLHQYPAIWGLPSLSPFCIKVEMFLRKQNIPYRTVVEKNPARGPKGKMPFIQDGKLVIPDSSFILQHLSAKRNVDDKIGPKEKAHALAFQRMIEEHLYFVLLYSRWVDPVGWEVIKRDFVSLFPPLTGLPFLHFLRSRLQMQAYQQGLGRHTQSEVYELGRLEIQALAEFLGEKSYFLGEEFSSLDATAYAFLITILKQPIASELQCEVLRHANLVEYCCREEALCFPDFVDRPGDVL